eukprot:7386512-Prymnesium_polylepis.1
MKWPSVVEAAPPRRDEPRPSEPPGLYGTRTHADTRTNADARTDERTQTTRAHTESTQPHTQTNAAPLTQPAAPLRSFFSRGLFVCAHPPARGYVPAFLDGAPSARPHCPRSPRGLHPPCVLTAQPRPRDDPGAPRPRGM